MSGEDRTEAAGERPGPVHDPGRLGEIAELGLLSDEEDEVLREIARTAAERLGLPVGLVSIVLSDAQVFAAAHGLTGWMDEARGTPVEWSFCVHSVPTRAPFVVEDAVSHPAMRESPLVRAEGVRCYAGIPLVTSRGHVLGNLCVMGTEERTFGPGELDVLRELAAAAVARIEAGRGAS